MCLVVILAGASSPCSSETIASEIRAQLTPRDFTTVAAEIGAKVEKVMVREGERFSKGQSLIAFDCSVQKANQDEATAALNGAVKSLEVNRRLFELKTIGQQEYDVSATEVDKSRARVAAGAAVMTKCKVSAPFDGRVVEQKVRSQQFVQPGQALLDLIDDSVLELDFVVPSKWLLWLKTGSPFDVSIDETGKTYPVKVARVGARIDPVSQTVKITGTIGKYYPELTAGMSGRVLLSPPQ